MATLDLQTISSGDSLDDKIMNNNINVLNAVPLTGTTLNNIPTFSPNTYISAESINNVFTKIKENWIDTSDGTAKTSDILDGKLAYVNGKSVMGTMPIVTQATPSISIDSSTGIITASATQAAGYVSAGTKKATKPLTLRSSNDLTVSDAKVLVPAGYYATNASKSVSTVAQANPIISVDSTTGTITASVTQGSGYVYGRTMTNTSELQTQPATTITPSTYRQTAVPAGYYTTGAVFVNPVPTQTKSATPSKSQQTVTPDSGKFLSSVTIGAIPRGYITTSDATATESDIANGKIAYVKGSKVKGNVTIRSDSSITSNNNIVTIPAGIYTSEVSKTVGTAKSAYTYIPTTYNQSISSGYYLTGTQTIAGDANLVPSNIKSGVSIFGVEGNVVTNEGDIYFTEILRATDITSNGKTYIANVTFDFDNYSIHITPTDVLDDYTIDRIRRVKHISLEIDIRESGNDYKGQFVMYSANSTAQTLWHWMYIQKYDGELDYYDYGRCSYDMDDSSKVATFSYTMSDWEDALDYIKMCDSSPTASGLITWQILEP